MRLSVIRYITDPTKGAIAYIDFTPTRIMDHWTDPNSAHKRVGYWIGETWLFDKVAPDGEPITDLSRVQSLDYASVSTPIGQKRKSCKSVTWNIAETYEYTVPEWRLRTPCPKERERTGKPHLPENTDSEEMHFCDLYARQLADAQMRAARRG